ncbi:MAG: glucose-fructose oxidoreductase [Lasallia pustulata]|uniref:Glucose-fructose oxidoreductase n=1 Tax=Lasallia pustulata TaxID=136370 RepID=A0A5M8PIJ9_9LECA|nr:MAG: glucose-fructose oxidoreductase [Lasallia pustulata]
MSDELIAQKLATLGRILGRPPRVDLSLHSGTLSKVALLEPSSYLQPTSLKRIILFNGLTVPIGVAIIGRGIFAREEHLPAVEASKELTLKAIYSRSLKSAKSLSIDTSSVDLYSDDSGEGKSYTDLLKRPDIQAVIIALPIPNQPLYIRAALSAGKHVLSEKPVAENLKDAQDFI